MRVAIPEQLVAVGEVLGLSDFEEVLDATSKKRRTDHRKAQRTFTACWLVPDKSVSFGKGSSCIVGVEFEVSCAEVELALTARKADWEGGWVRSYPPDRRFPPEWRSAVISKRDACRWTLDRTRHGRKAGHIDSRRRGS